MEFATLHIRLTRDCNAHCDYCSSAGVEEGRMRPENFRKSVDFLADRVLPRMRVGRDHVLTVEYLGGEVLLVPEAELRDAVSYARTRLKPLVRGFRDGAQSNLIGSPRRVVALHDLFDGNLGTSWDNHTDKRHIRGSAELYRGLLGRSLGTLEAERGHRPGRVIVLDRNTAAHAETEVADAISGGYDLVLRPVFQGGSQDVDSLSPAETCDVLEACYRLWSRSPATRIEPFHSLFSRRIARGRADGRGDLSARRTAGCPFQSDCAFRSISLDPDGTLHVCQEMADAGNYPLGNAVEGRFDDRTWRLLARRSAKLSSDCTACQWREECGGGCMNEAIEAHGDPFARTELCPAWKTIFRAIETDIDSGRAHEIEQEIA